MLELTKNPKLSNNLSIFYLRAFKEENEFSWDYLVNAYYGKAIKIFVEKILKNFKYGCFVLDKKLMINNEPKQQHSFLVLLVMNALGVKGT